MADVNGWTAGVNGWRTDGAEKGPAASNPGYASWGNAPDGSDQSRPSNAPTSGRGAIDGAGVEDWRSVSAACAPG